jgi:hypothetical protein
MVRWLCYLTARYLKIGVSHFGVKSASIREIETMEMIEDTGTCEYVLRSR